ncbi:hypothetical protein IVG45_09445 [Methylomonas sp. LL1]|uniref:hypothetical protein n=1 Tax=Methylomonas sp. LL1 TaxID=2785785 RepID=UPI0018C42165|nr:hypothetical protein [Methylomonas sp. LL1]QPK65131.1 hypothetical protein IVG45_09445 [Methylomonas sp. LL1]
MSESSTNVTIVVAVIGVIGSITVALISHWDKLNPPPAKDAPIPQPIVLIGNTSDPAIASITKPQPAPPKPVINIAGNWYNPAAPAAGGSYITQQSEHFEFQGWGLLPQGIGFQTEGNGSLIDQQVNYSYVAQYQNGWTSQGNCSGTVSANGVQMTTTCTDNIMGTFVSTGVKK